LFLKNNSFYRYLHHVATPRIIHGDVKASNVLVDSEFSAKVADFGFVKLIPEGASNMRGSLGYLAPEYDGVSEKGSESCDVYSFGILLLELISGKKPIENIGHGVKSNIIDWTTPLLEEGKVEEIVDPRLEGRYDEEEVIGAVQVASMCLQHSPEKRPTMLEVVNLLKRKTKGGDTKISPDAPQIRADMQNHVE
jgi:serine/threonine protein kinase